MAKKTTSASQKGCYARYKADNRAKTNKVRKLEKHIAANGEDAQSAAALAKLQSSNYTGRVKPSRTKSNLYKGVGLNKPSGRTGRPAQEFLALVKQAKAGIQEAMHLPVKMRAANGITVRTVKTK